MTHFQERTNPNILLSVHINYQKIIEIMIIFNKQLSDKNFSRVYEIIKGRTTRQNEPNCRVPQKQFTKKTFF